MLRVAWGLASGFFESKIDLFHFEGTDQGRLLVRMVERMTTSDLLWNTEGRKGSRYLHFRVIKGLPGC
jgi:hypothetical protein